MPTPPTTPSALIAVRANIYNQLASEIGTSGGRLSTTPFPSTAVKAVGYSWLNTVKQFPYVSIYASGTDENVSATRQKFLDMHFVIGMAYQSAVSLEDAYTQLYTLMDDNNGNGLEAILRDPAHFTWGDLVSFSQIKSVRYYDNVKDNRQSTQNTYITYAVVQYDARQVLTWSGTFQ